MDLGKELLYGYYMVITVLTMVNFYMVHTNYGYYRVNDNMSYIMLHRLFTYATIRITHLYVYIYIYTCIYLCIWVGYNMSGT